MSKQNLNTSCKIIYPNKDVLTFKTIEEASKGTEEYSINHPELPKKYRPILSVAAIKLRCNKSTPAKDGIICEWLDQHTKRSYQAKKSKSKGNALEYRIRDRLRELGYNCERSAGESKKLDNAKVDIIDLDGTMYRGNTNIDGAREFIDYLHLKNLPYIFLTNNATRTKKQAKEHMLNLGFKDIKEEDFFTSAMAAAKFIAKNYSEKKCFMLGESGLEEALKEYNFEIVKENANFVVVGLDRNATYKSYSEALHHILAGAKFIATNPDRLLANNGTFDIGNGAVIDMLEYASGVEAIKIGKPYQIILDILLEEKNLKKEDLIFIGDNLETDIKLGYDAKIETIMVCSGVHTEKDIERLKVYPTRVVKNLRELIKQKVKKLVLL